jgi:hypothetical protein
VQANGPWTLTVLLPGHLEQPEEAQSYEFSGNGNDVTPVFQLADGRTNVHLTHNGTGHFGVIIYNVTTEQRGGLRANEIGEADVSTTFSAGAGPHLISVAANGDWTITIEQP